MALATQCPHCGTTFRVAHDQLKLRAGLVRCGACKEIFNGIEHLLRASELAKPTDPMPDAEGGVRDPWSKPEASATDPVPTVPDANPAAPALLPGTVPIADREPYGDNGQAPDTGPETWSGYHDTGQPAPAASDAGMEPAPLEPAVDDPLQRMTLLDVARYQRLREDGSSGSEQATENNEETDAFAARDAAALEQAIDDLQRKPLRRSRQWPAAQAEELDEPDFMVQARRQSGGRLRRVALACACFLLLLGALAQGAYTFRSQLAAHFPPTGPVLAAACAALGCRVYLPMQIESVAIESSELQALAPDKNTFALSVLLRNRSATMEAWPHIELTLNDTGEQALVRRVFVPREYLPAGHSEKLGFAAYSEQALRVYFELLAPKAAGYRVYLFYP